MAREDPFDVSETHFEILHQPLIKYSHNDTSCVRFRFEHILRVPEKMPQSLFSLLLRSLSILLVLGLPPPRAKLHHPPPSVALRRYRRSHSRGALNLITLNYTLQWIWPRSDTPSSTQRDSNTVNVLLLIKGTVTINPMAGS